MSEQLQAQVVELQTQVAFQEEAISELNQALIKQQEQLAVLERQWELLKDQAAQQSQPQSSPVTAAEPPPPHY